MMALVPEAMPMVKSGRMRALAVTTPKRLAAYPDWPEIAELEPCAPCEVPSDARPAAED